MENIRKLPKHIEEQLQRKGYFNLTTEQRVESNKHSFGSLIKSSKGDSIAEEQALRDMRGGYR